MRRDRQQGGLSRVQQLGLRPAKAFRPSASRITGSSASEHGGANELLRLVIGGKAGANRQHRLALNDRRRNVRSRNSRMLALPASVASRGAVISSGMPAATIGKHVAGRRHGRQARADAQRRASRQHGSAGLPQRARNDQGVAKVPLFESGGAPAADRGTRPARANAASDVGSSSSNSGGVPISRTIRLTHAVGARRHHWPSFGAVSVTVASAAITGPPKSSASEAGPRACPRRSRAPASAANPPRLLLAPAVHVLDHLRQQAFDGPLQAGAQQRVHDEVRFIENAAGDVPCLLLVTTRNSPLPAAASAADSSPRRRASPRVRRKG